jgi:hypothetical protein
MKGEEITMKALPIRFAVFLLSAGLLLPGCIVIGTTELRVTFNEGGGATVTMVCSDIRSDAPTDAARLKDYGVMMASLNGDGLRELERRQDLTFIGKRFTTSGDSLNAEVQYFVHRAEDVEGLRITNDAITVVVSAEREIVRTNGTVGRVSPLEQKITWPADARELIYVIRERALPPSVSLATLFTTYGELPDSAAADTH